jgi:transposase-like protein
MDIFIVCPTCQRRHYYEVPDQIEVGMYDPEAVGLWRCPDCHREYSVKVTVTLEPLGAHGTVSTANA